MSESWENFLSKKHTYIPQPSEKRTAKEILNAMWDRMYPGFPFHSVNLSKKETQLLSLEETILLIRRMDETLTKIRTELDVHLAKSRVKLAK